MHGDANPISLGAGSQGEGKGPAVHPTNALSYLIDRAAFSRRFHYLTKAHRRRIGSDRRDVPAMPVGALGEMLLDGAVARVRFESLGALLDEGGRRQIGELIEQCARGWSWQSDVLLPQDVASQLPGLYLLGLSPAMLAAVETYLEQPCLYLGAALKIERVSPARGNRLWHMDVEDLRMLRVLIYLNDVNEKDGPLEVIPPDQSDQARAALGYRSGYVRDERMAQVVPPVHWAGCLADEGDALIFDGSRLFHRAQPPVERERFSLTFSYSTRRPLQVYRKARLLDRTQRPLLHQLAPDLRPYLPRARVF